MFITKSEQVTFLLLSVLSDRKLHTYKALASKLNCSTITLLKSVNIALNYGVNIDFVSGIGFCWNKPFIRINGESVNSYLGKYQQYFDLNIFDTLDSTNTYLLDNYSSYLNSRGIPVVVTDLQTNGRGTNHRTWFSNLGGSLTFSILWKFNQSIKHISSLSLALGVCLVRVIQNYTSKTVHLKWPNDILYNKKKLAGILIECKPDRDGSVVAVIGIGINIKLTTNLAATINSAVTDLSDICGMKIDRNHILALLLIELRHVLTSFEISGFGILRDEWERYHAYQGQNVVLKSSYHGNIEGIVDGVQDDGSLVLSTVSGRKVFNVGEISLRPHE